MSENINFEKSMDRLAEITEKLSSGDLSLDDSMELFEEGLKLIKESDEKLKGFEKNINELVEKYQGE